MNPTLQGPDPRVRFQGVHLHLTESLAATIYGKFGALLRHDPKILRIDIKLNKTQTLGYERIFAATARIEVPGPDLAASEQGKEAYGVLEALAGKVDRLLEKRRGKRDHGRGYAGPQSELGVRGE